MRIVVMKFGGSSVADAAAIERVVAIVAAQRQQGAAPVVVVSALGGVTDRLLALAAGAPEDRDAAVDALARRHKEVMTGLDADQDGEIARFIEGRCEEVRTTFHQLSAGQPDPPTLDLIAAAGELLSSRIVAAAMASRGLPAAWVDARDAIVTDGQHTAAIPLAAETADAARRATGEHMTAGRIPVLGGFVGRTREGATTTLGRGGSDYSASLIGAAIDASEIQIWTDVDGMLTADPRIVPDAEVVRHLSFAEAAELAYFGAKVLHPSTIFPAVSRNIPVKILNSRRPDALGTLITGTPAPDERPFASLACKRGITVIDITSSRMLMAHGFLSRVFEVFEKYSTAVDVVTTSEVSVSVTVDDRRRVPEIIAALSEVADVTVEDDLAILSVVGDRLRTHSALAARIIGAMTDFPLRMVSQAASRRNLTMVLPETHLAAAMMHLHREFFSMAGSPR